MGKSKMATCTVLSRRSYSLVVSLSTWFGYFMSSMFILGRHLHFVFPNSSVDNFLKLPVQEWRPGRPSQFPDNFPSPLFGVTWPTHFQGKASCRRVSKRLKLWPKHCFHGMVQFSKEIQKMEWRGEELVSSWSWNGLIQGKITNNVVDP